MAFANAPRSWFKKMKFTIKVGESGGTITRTIRLSSLTTSTVGLNTMNCLESLIDTHTRYLLKGHSSGYRT